MHEGFKLIPYKFLPEMEQLIRPQHLLKENLLTSLSIFTHNNIKLLELTLYTLISLYAPRRLIIIQYIKKMCLFIIYVILFREFYNNEMK